MTAVPGGGLGSAPGARPATRPTATADNRKRLIANTPFGFFTGGMEGTVTRRARYH